MANRLPDSTAIPLNPFPEGLREAGIATCSDLLRGLPVEL